MTAPLAIALLDQFRRALTEGGPPLPDMTQRALLDTLGVGNRQTFDFLVQHRPTLAEFEAWIIATAGEPDRDLVSRFNARFDGGELTEAARRALEAIDAMPDVLDTDALTHWEREGFVVLKQALPLAECVVVADQLWETLDARPDDPQSWYGDVTEGIMVPLLQHPALEKARRSPRIHKAFAQLWGTPDLWTTIDQLGFNPPEFGSERFRGSDIHWDVSLVPPISFATQAVLYLTDTAADQGAFRCVPGFHHRIEDWIAGLGGQNPREVDLSRQAVAVPGQAGDLVIWRQDLPHGASPNRTGTPRLVQYLNYYSPELKVASEWV